MLINVSSAMLRNVQAQVKDAYYHLTMHILYGHGTNMKHLQGDPGGTRFFLSFEDDIFKIFGADKMTGEKTSGSLLECPIRMAPSCAPELSLNFFQFAAADSILFALNGSNVCRLHGREFPLEIFSTHTTDVHVDCNCRTVGQFQGAGRHAY
jgi:hypothetical protein